MHELGARVLKKKVEILPLLTEEEEKESQQLDLKPLPVELKYAFLEEDKQCPVVISSLLTTPQEDNLLQLLKRFKRYQPNNLHPSHLFRRRIKSC